MIRNFSLCSQLAVTAGKRLMITGLVVGLLHLSVSGFADLDTEVPTIAITAVNITKLGGGNVYEFLYSIEATDNVAVTEIEIHGAVANGDFDAWRPYDFFEGYPPMRIILDCTEFRFEVRAKDAAGNYSLPAGHHFKAEPEITGNGAPVSAKGKVGKKFVYRVSASAADRFACSKLPKGLKFNRKTGKIKGVPQKSGKFKVTVSAINSVGTKKQTVSLNIAD